MKAIVQDAYGTADNLKLQDIDRPVPRDDEVLLRVHAAGVDPSVWHLMTGRPFLVRLALGLRKPKQRIRGWDVAGTVEETGAEVTGLKPGDEVFGSAIGTFAEYVCAKPAKLVPKPGNLTFDQAAALPVSAVTAYQALRKADPRPGRKILIIGASGGVGTFAVQLAAVHGLRITGVCGPDKADLVRSLGADEVIDYTREDITRGAARYDIILDLAGNRPLSRLRRVLAPRGTLVLAGGEDGGAVLGGMGRQLRAVLLTPFIRQHLRNHLASVRQDDLLTVRDLAEKGEITPAIDRTYPLAEAADAVRHLESGHPRGKLVITV